jgi:two-component system phosphate regulon response regulator PhoB
LLPGLGKSVKQLETASARWKTLSASASVVFDPDYPSTKAPPPRRARRAIFRWTWFGSSESSQQIRIGTLLLDLPRDLVRVQNRSINLTATEFKLLTVLAQRRGRVQSREQLLRDVWGYDTPIDTRTVDTYMRRLREKLNSAARHLDTVRGVGYRFIEE